MFVPAVSNPPLVNCAWTADEAKENAMIVTQQRQTFAIMRFSIRSIPSRLVPVIPTYPECANDCTALENCQHQSQFSPISFDATVSYPSYATGVHSASMRLQIIYCKQKVMLAIVCCIGDTLALSKLHERARNHETQGHRGET